MAQDLGTIVKIMILVLRKAVFVLEKQEATVVLSELNPEITWKTFAVDLEKRNTISYSFYIAF